MDHWTLLVLFPVITSSGSKLIPFNSFVETGISVICSSISGVTKLYAYMARSGLLASVRSRFTTSKKSRNQYQSNRAPNITRKIKSRNRGGPCSIPTSHHLATQMSCTDYVELGFMSSKSVLRDFEIAHVKESVEYGLIRKEVTWELRSERRSVSPDALQEDSIHIPESDC